MQSIYRLKASELDNSFLAGLKAVYQDKEIEITVCEIDKSQHQPLEFNREDSNISNLNSESLSQRRAFLKLPLAERRRLLSQQASQMAEHYQENVEWQEWLAGNIVD